MIQNKCHLRRYYSETQKVTIHTKQKFERKLRGKKKKKKRDFELASEDAIDFASTCIS